VYKVFSRKGMELNGYIETDLSLKGRQSDAMAGRYEKLNNKGILKLRNIAFSSDDYPKPFILKTGNFRFDQEKVWFDDFLVNYGVSDFRLKGSTLNTISYLMSQGKALKGDFRMNSELIDADEFTYFAPSKGSTNAKSANSGVVIIPRDLDVDFDATVKQTRFQGLDIRDLHGEIDIKEGILALSNSGFTLAGCTVNMDATYGSITPEKAFFDFRMKAEDFDIKRAYNEVALIRELATSAGSAEGIVSLEYALKGRLNGEMYPIMPSLEGGGVISLNKVKVNGLKLFNDISKSTQREGIANPDMSKVDIRSTIKNNIITLEQFKFKVSGLRLRISGSTTLDNQLNLRIRIGLPPLGIFGIPLKITGSADNPKIRYGRGKGDEDLPDSEYSDELPPEMLQRIKNARDEGGDDNEPVK
jgi:AsmA protein